MTGAEPQAETVRARYLVGCDGANSTVRTLLGLPVTDLGFFFDWLILDMIPNEPMTFDPPGVAAVRSQAAHHHRAGRPGPTALGVHGPAGRGR